MCAWRGVCVCVCVCVSCEGRGIDLCSRSIWDKVNPSIVPIVCSVYFWTLKITLGQSKWTHTHTHTNPHILRVNNNYQSKYNVIGINCGRGRLFPKGTIIYPNCPHPMKIACILLYRTVLIIPPPLAFFFYTPHWALTTLKRG